MSNGPRVAMLALAIAAIPTSASADAAKESAIEWQISLVTDAVGISQHTGSSIRELGLLDAERCAHRKDTGFELTYADKLADWLTVQPFVQLGTNADHERGARHTFIYTPRQRIDLSPP